MWSWNYLHYLYQEFLKNVFATENNRNAYKCLLNAIEINNIKNIHAARLSSDEVAQLDTGRNFLE